MRLVLSVNLLLAFHLQKSENLLIELTNSADRLHWNDIALILYAHNVFDFA